MPVRRHGKGWEVRLQHDGQRISRSFSSYRDARQGVEDRRVGRAETHTLEEAIDRWLGNEAKALHSFDNLQNKVRVIYKHIAGKRLDEVGAAAKEITEAGLAAHLKPATINRRLAILRRVARLAHRNWDWTDRDLGAKVKLLPGEEPRYVQATLKEAEKLLAAAEEGRPREAILWAIGTGLRQGELRRVQPHHFRDGALAVEKKTKTGRPRMVPLPPFLKPEDFPYGLTSTDVEERYREARSKAGMPWLQFRDLRRTYGSWMAQKTGNLKAVQQALGHTTMQITSKHYAHLLHDDVSRAVRTTFAGMARGQKKKNNAP
jgi:integrase